jgi:hypothetical protein
MLMVMQMPPPIADADAAQKSKTPRKLNAGVEVYALLLATRRGSVQGMGQTTCRWN